VEIEAEPCLAKVLTSHDLPFSPIQYLINGKRNKDEYTFELFEENLPDLNCGELAYELSGSGANDFVFVTGFNRTISVHTNYGPNAQTDPHELFLHVWFEDFSEDAVKAIHEIKIPFEVMVRSVCADNQLNLMQAQKMYHMLGHEPGVQIIKASDTMSRDYGNGYDLCGPRIYTIVNPRPDFDNFSLNYQTGILGQLTFEGQSRDVADELIAATLVATLEWYPHVTKSTALLGVVVEGCETSYLVRAGQIMPDLY